MRTPEQLRGDAERLRELAEELNLDAERADGLTSDVERILDGGGEADIRELTELSPGYGEFVVAELDVSKYSRAEIDAAIASLADYELPIINDWLTRSTPERATVSSWLFANVGATQLERSHGTGTRVSPSPWGTDLPDCYRPGELRLLVQGCRPFDLHHRMRRSF